MRKIPGAIYWMVLVVSAIHLLACSGKPESGPGKVRWDREICTRCAMALSDRHFAAQIRGGPLGEKPKLYKFDDIGCAVIWLDKQPWKDNPNEEIWVNDHRTGEWLDARKAWYVTGQTTPMDYELGAEKDKSEGALTFEQAKKHIYEVEQRFSAHGGEPVSSESTDEATPAKGGQP